MNTQKLAEDIEQHLILIDQVNKLSLLLLKASIDENINEITAHTENRTRLINNVERTQGMIEAQLETLKPSQTPPELLEILQVWANDVAKWVEFTHEVDQKSAEIIEGLREQTTQELGHLYRSRTQFKGYNLRNVKK